MGSRRFNMDLHGGHESNPNPSREGSLPSEPLGRFPSREGSGGGWVYARFFLPFRPARWRWNSDENKEVCIRGAGIWPAVLRALPASRRQSSSPISIEHWEHEPFTGRARPQPGKPEPGERGWVRKTSRGGLIP